VQPTPGETLSTEVTSSAQAVADRIAAIPRKVDRRAVELWREGYTNVQIAAKLSQEGMPGYGKGGLQGGYASCGKLTAKTSSPEDEERLFSVTGGDIALKLRHADTRIDT